MHDAALRANHRTRILARALALLGLAPLALASAALAATTPTKPKGDGRVLFRKHCGTCHRLAAAKTHGNVGPNLAVERVAFAEGVWVINGGLCTMPGFKGTLKPAQVRDVAAFLAKATNA